jgi:hypothetical protein
MDHETALGDLRRIAQHLADRHHDDNAQGDASDLLAVAQWFEGKDAPESVAVYEWSESSPNGYLHKLRTKTVREVYEELRAILGEYPDGGEEYFSIAPSVRGEAEWPDGDIVSFSVNGSSEGDFVHVEVHRNGHRELVFLGKTFQGRDASWAFARRLADLLEIQ